MPNEPLERNVVRLMIELFCRTGHTEEADKYRGLEVLTTEQLHDMLVKIHRDLPVAMRAVTEPQVNDASRALMRVLIMAEAEDRLAPDAILRMLQQAKDEIMTLRAERERGRMDEQDEHFDLSDAVKCLTHPALPFLERMAATYQERRATYGANEQTFADIMLALFPTGLHLQTRADWVRYGLFHQIVTKISRYVRSWSEPHVDSIHDVGPYSAMLEAEDRRHLHRPPFNFVIPDDQR